MGLFDIFKKPQRMELPPDLEKKMKAIGMVLFPNGQRDIQEGGTTIRKLSRDGARISLSHAGGGAGGGKGFCMNIKAYQKGDVILDTYLVEDIRSGAEHQMWKRT